MLCVYAAYTPCPLNKFSWGSLSLRCQDFYEEQLEDNFRQERFVELGKKEGLQEGKIRRLLQDGKAPTFFTSINLQSFANFEESLLH